MTQNSTIDGHELNRPERAVRFAVKVLICSIWALVGGLLWIAMLTRVTALLAVATVYSNVSGRDTSSISRQLDRAIGLYWYGFVRIWRMSEPQPPGEKGFDLGAFFHVLIEIGWTVIHWGLILVLLEKYGVLRPVVSTLVENIWHGMRQ